MRVLKKGDLNKIAPWYDQTPWTCDACGCEFRTDRTDFVGNIASHHNEDIVYTTCPTCSGRVTKDHADVDKPTRIRYTRGNAPQ